MSLRDSVKSSDNQRAAAAAAGRSPNWPIKRLRFLISKTIPSHRAFHRVDELTFLPMESIGEQGALDLSATRSVDDVRSGYTQIADGDVVVAKITPCFENGKGALVRGLAGGVGLATTELHVLTPGPDLDGRFLYYITVDPRFRKLGEAYMFGAAGQQRVPEEFVAARPDHAATAQSRIRPHRTHRRRRRRTGRRGRAGGSARRHLPGGHARLIPYT